MVAQEVGVLSDADLANIAKTEVNEEADRISSDVQAVKDWLAKQPHLQNIRRGECENILLKTATVMSSYRK